MSRCKVCGSRVPDGISECPMCGAKISNSKNTGSQEAQATPAKQKTVKPQDSVPVTPVPKSSASSSTSNHTQAKCKVCGSSIPDGASACPMCGAKVKTPASTESPVQKPSPIQPQENHNPSPNIKPKPVQPRTPVTPPPIQPPIEPYRPEPSPSPNPSEISSAVSYVMAQNAKIRAASDRIVDTNALMDEMTTPKNKKDNGFAFMASRIRKDAGMAKAWENVVNDIETTKTYIFNHQYNDSTYKNAVEDFMQSANIAISAIEKMRKNCSIGIFSFPFITIFCVFIMYFLLCELKQLGFIIDVGIVFMYIFIFVDFIVLIIQKNRLNSFLLRIKK